MQSRYKKTMRDRMYRIYITDSLKVIGNLDVRYYDFIQETPRETRTADEIKDSIKSKLRAISGEG